MKRKFLFSVLFCLTALYRLSAQGVTVQADGKSIIEVISQIYANMADESKRESVNRITLKLTPALRVVKTGTEA